MGYRNLRQCVDDLEKSGQLRRVTEEVDPYLEVAEIQRRVYANGGPALYFERVKGCPFPLVSNLYGTPDRIRFLFRDSLELVKRLVELKVEPAVALRAPWRYLRAFPVAWAMQPKYVSRGPILDCESTLDQLPQMTSWSRDGGPFITLPAVYTEHPAQPGWQKSNLGMYRVQMAGNEYQPNRQIGLHYQIHRSIGVHHSAAIDRGEVLKVNIFVGGPPTIPLAAVMPLPEGLSELTFAGALSGHRMRLVRQSAGLPLLAEADFCICGTIDPNQQLPEGPFGDHLGYYSLTHDFPVINVDRVLHRKDAIWPFTVVGRPPQEDTSFGDIIHEITGPAIPSVLPGVKAVHAVDEAGVHPLLLAIGSERYVPYAAQRRPQELLTQANAILGQGQLSLAKYLLIVAGQDNPDLDIHNMPAFFKHLLERIDWTTDLHFQTNTTIDTLDYSGHGFNAGSKVVMAAAGEPRRSLSTELPSGISLPNQFSDARLCLPGICAIQAQKYEPGNTDANQLASAISPEHPLRNIPLLLLVDDAQFTARTLANFLWVTFTRSNPATDIHGVDSSIQDKHWGCQGPLIIDARIKPHHAPPLVEDPEVTRRVDALGAKGKSLFGLV
ncbi:MAG: UbiD family decarboxylase [Planctomycetaceae bacterium]|nr:UbiD family decarboxylase [Planctomycetaceae bacterium]